jgi:hypothetical protein
MHLTRINISDLSQIMINSPEVCLGITRQYAQVGHKTITIFSSKNHYSGLEEMKNNLYKKHYNITWCNFWRRC